MPKTGYVACNYTDGDTLYEVSHGPIRRSARLALADARRLDLDGVRWVHTDEYLYVDKPPRGEQNPSSLSSIKDLIPSSKKVKAEIRRVGNKIKVYIPVSSLKKATTRKRTVKPKRRKRR